MTSCFAESVPIRGSRYVRYGHACLGAVQISGVGIGDCIAFGDVYIDSNTCDVDADPPSLRCKPHIPSVLLSAKNCSFHANK